MIGEVIPFVSEYFARNTVASKEVNEFVCNAFSINGPQCDIYSVEINGSRERYDREISQGTETRGM